jgi:predicted DNA-binding transcriptional regulator AlpA
MELTRMLGRQQVEALTGFKRNALWERIADGLFVKPVHIGSENVARWPSHEIEAINRAWIAGLTPDQVRALVVKLESERTGTPATPRRSAKRRQSSAVAAA